MTFDVQAGELATTCGQLRKVTGGKPNDRIKLNVSTASVYASMQGEGTATRAKLDAYAQGDALAVLFNGRYVAEACRLVKDSRVRWQFTDDSSQALMEPVDLLPGDIRYRVVVMPMRP